MRQDQRYGLTGREIYGIAVEQPPALPYKPAVPGAQTPAIVGWFILPPYQEPELRIRKDSMQSVIMTPQFATDARNAGLAEDEVQTIVTRLASAPQSGDVIPGTDGARKLRFGGRGKGKSGGYRVIAFYAGADVPVFLLNVFAKGDRIDLSQAERNALRRELAILAEDYREGVRHSVERR